MANHLVRSIGLALVIGAAAQSALAAGDVAVKRGRYLVQVGGCNDCHTPGYAASGGKVPEKDWLVGDALGYRGPWGTTYPANLRTYFAAISEREWLAIARGKEMRPPMPWFNLRAMSDDDLRAVYRYVKSLGAGGKPAPGYVAPDRTPDGPFIQWPQGPAKP